MPNDRQVVTARAVLQAVLAVQRQGNHRMIQHLEQIEPELVEYFLETLTQIAQNLSRQDLPEKTRRRLVDQLESMCLVCITAVRKAHYDLWQQTPMGDELLRRDPSLAEPQDQADGQAPPPTE